MGRGKHKPTQVRLLEGGRSNSLPKPDQVNEPQPKAIPPKRPFYLDKPAKKIWNHLAPKLTELGLLTEIDGPMFAMFCQVYSRTQYIGTELKNTNNSTLMIDQITFFGKDERRETKVAHPMVPHERKYMELVRKFAAEFGLSPRGRAGLVVGSNPNEGQDLI